VNNVKLAFVFLAFACIAPAATVTTLIGDGTPGFSDTQVNNPYGLVIGPDGGPDGALYFCDLDNQRIRRLDLRTKQLTTIAGDGQKGYRGDGGPALQASLNMPHELRFDPDGDLYIAERDNHVIRKIDMKTGSFQRSRVRARPAFPATVVRPHPRSSISRTASTSIAMDLSSSATS
jgi:streptogramin lyase